MPWWPKALATIAVVSGTSLAVHKYNDHYTQVLFHGTLVGCSGLQKGQVHPITAFLARHTCDEAADRKRRIEDVQAQAELSDLRHPRTPYPDLTLL